VRPGPCLTVAEEADAEVMVVEVNVVAVIWRSWRRPT
jgi:hypothetical protein